MASNYSDRLRRQPTTVVIHQRVVIDSPAMDPGTTLVDRLRTSGRKCTPQRLLVASLIDGNDEHPTAEAVWAMARTSMPTLSLKTVYSILHELAALGELQLLDVGTGATRFDPATSDHHHLVCTECGKVRDLHVSFDGLDLPASAAQGFVVGQAEVVFRGRCADCAA
jgi:Fur family ferric uptake transcriptional regulator